MRLTMVAATLAVVALGVGCWPPNPNSLLSTTTDEGRGSPASSSDKGPASSVLAVTSDTSEEPAEVTASETASPEPVATTAQEPLDTPAPARTPEPSPTSEPTATTAATPSPGATETLALVGTTVRLRVEFAGPRFGIEVLDEPSIDLGPDTQSDWTLRLRNTDEADRSFQVYYLDEDFDSEMFRDIQVSGPAEVTVEAGATVALAGTVTVGPHPRAGVATIVVELA